MNFSKISELELARLFVYSKKEKIEKLLDVKDLDTYTATEILYKFILEHQSDFLSKIPNRYGLLFDDVFFYLAISELQSVKKDGTQLDGGPRFVEPNVMYVS